MPTNDQEIAYWNSQVGERWARLQPRVDAQFAPITAALLAAAELVTGEHVLDVGCGAGSLSLACADRVGSQGRVLGVDVSEPLLARARRRAGDRKKTEIDFVSADASSFPFDASFDLLISRFGVMFFDDPIAAFMHLRSALKPQGRVLFVCWQSIARNPWFSVPLGAVREVQPSTEKADPLAPGPFAFSDPMRVQMILESAGFSSVSITPHECEIALGVEADIDAIVDFFSSIGPTARVLAEASANDRGEMIVRLRRALLAHVGPDGITLGAAVHVVRATR